MRRFQVYGCMQGWRSMKVKQRKALIVTTSEPNLEEALQEKCIRQPDEHEMIQGNETQRSEQYPKKFVRRFSAALEGRKLEKKVDVTNMHPNTHATMLKRKQHMKFTIG